MAALSDEQISFLRSQGIPLSAMFDGSAMAMTDCQVAMKADGKNFAYGVSPCKKGGHTLRTRRWHCMQCNHAAIAFILRHDAPAYVYIAASAAGRLIKIGSTIDVADRVDKLNRYQYGGQNDWQILANASTPSAGRAESSAQNRLSAFNVHGEYIRAGRRQRCYELFHCDFQDARDALTQALGRGIVLKVPNEARAMAAFNFLTQSGGTDP